MEKQIRRFENLTELEYDVIFNKQVRRPQSRCNQRSLLVYMPPARGGEVMASRTKIQTTTKRGALRNINQHLDCLSSQSAQIIRMRHGISGDDEDVGGPPEECSSNMRRRILAIEKIVIERALGKATTKSTQKQKIIKALREKS